MIKKYFGMFFSISLLFMLVFSNYALAEDVLEGEVSKESKKMNLLEKVGIDFNYDSEYYEEDRHNNYYSHTGQKIPNAHEGEPTVPFDCLNAISPKINIDFKTKEEKESKDNEKKSTTKTKKKTTTKQKTNIKLESVK